MPKKMLILRGKSGTYPAEDGIDREYKTGALHEQDAKDFATKLLHYDEGKVLDVSGETGAHSAQTSQALIMLRDKGGNEFTALYGFSGGGYNVLHILSALKEEERKRFEWIVVLGAPPTVLKDGKYVYSSTGSPQKSAFLAKNFKGGSWTLVYQAFIPSSFKPPNGADGHMFLPKWLLSQPLPSSKTSP